MRESKVESLLTKRVDHWGGICEKHVSPQKSGVRDRVVMWHYGITHWIETKAPGKDPEAHQQRDHERLRKLGHVVMVIDTIEKVELYVSTIVHILGHLRLESRALQELPEVTASKAVPLVASALRCAGLLARQAP